MSIIYDFYENIANELEEYCKQCDDFHYPLTGCFGKRKTISKEQLEQAIKYIMEIKHENK